MSTRQNVTLPSPASVNEYLCENKIDLVDGSQHYDFTAINWTIDVVGSNMMLFVPGDIEDQDSFEDGFCLGTITDVSQCTRVDRGKKTFNLSVSFFLYPHNMPYFDNLKKW
jgi:hypothetical protein